jgi:hypothetical protein
MEFKLQIDMDNAAFADDDGTFEVARILRDVADGFETSGDTGFVRDFNGNRVGSWEFTELSAVES